GARFIHPHRAGGGYLPARGGAAPPPAREMWLGVHGEALILPTPVHCRVAPGALRVRVPRKRPGVPTAQPRLNWRRLRKLAAPAGRA
ncbi:diacylglycerol kinase, partial [Streptomyces sp. NPDC058307]